ncbi:MULTISPECIES: DUF2474 family protein [Shewanella]|uniref:Protein of uncharacterized function (DUF2474) n=3 Tax=Bacteria TaxID=2 RepID=A0A379YX03_9GAMM|nr:DUF2474 family protein [Shewanella algae]NJI86147.1 DUF2474 family protein [Shewanella sp. Iso12]AYV12692.1 DUF2474 family protein [Shewanella algae]MBC8794756.1 DUF2474 family protein [Shewanella algae]MBO2551328.1 DUF2474 family protein [Shewanella algae]MBO2555589.1 DUF2474 family protein [Shewanella algae]
MKPIIDALRGRAIRLLAPAKNWLDSRPGCWMLLLWCLSVLSLLSVSSLLRLLMSAAGLKA